MDLPNPCIQRLRQLKQTRRDALRRARKRPGRTVAFCGVRGRARTADAGRDAHGRAREAPGTHTGRAGRARDAQRDAQDAQRTHRGTQTHAYGDA